MFSPNEITHIIGRNCGGCGGSVNRRTKLNTTFGVANVTNDEHKSTIYPGDVLISVGNTQLIDNVSSMEDVIQIFTSYPTRPLTVRFARRIRKENHNYQQQKGNKAFTLSCGRSCGYDNDINLAKDDDGSTTTTTITSSDKFAKYTTATSFPVAHDHVEGCVIDKSAARFDKDRRLAREISFESNINGDIRYAHDDTNDDDNCLTKSRSDNRKNLYSITERPKMKNKIKATQEDTKDDILVRKKLQVDVNNYITVGTGDALPARNVNASVNVNSKTVATAPIVTLAKEEPKDLTTASAISSSSSSSSNSQDQTDNTLGHTVIDLLSDDKDEDEDKAGHPKLQVFPNFVVDGPSLTNTVTSGPTTGNFNPTTKDNSLKQNNIPHVNNTDRQKKQGDNISSSFVINLLEEDEDEDEDDDDDDDDDDNNDNDEYEGRKNQLVLNSKTSNLDNSENKTEDENLEDNDGVVIIGSSAEPIDIDLLEVENGHTFRQTMGPLEADVDIQITGSTGKNALSDFPHARHLCLVKPFTKNPEEFCSNCYCYICDIKASECSEWQDLHCKADSDIKWHRRRSKIRNKRKAPERALQRLASSFLNPETDNNTTSTLYVSSKRRSRRLNILNINT